MVHGNSVNACVIESKSKCSDGKEQGSVRVCNKTKLRVSRNNWNLLFHLIWP